MFVCVSSGRNGSQIDVSKWIAIVLRVLLVPSLLLGTEFKTRCVDHVVCQLRLHGDTWGKEQAL